MALPPGEWDIGRHQLRFEPPDIIWTRFRGTIYVEDAMRMAKVSEELGSVRPFFMVGDMKESGLPEPEAARYFSENLRFEWFLGMIYIGSRLAHRAAARGILLAAYLTEYTKDAHVLRKVHFVPTRAEAEALMIQLRADLGVKPPGAQVQGRSENALEPRGPATDGREFPGQRRTREGCCP